MRNIFLFQFVYNQLHYGLMSRALVDTFDIISDFVLILGVVFSFEFFAAAPSIALTKSGTERRFDISRKGFQLGYEYLL